MHQPSLARFIPAGAGNTVLHSTSSDMKPVYPRWRGEHERSIEDVKPDDGLSPLARGTLAAIPLSFRSYRFIPAGAGNTYHNGGITFPVPVYPRWRGEHRGKAQEFDGIRGLSPLARGTQQIKHMVLAAYRFIPAGAGNTARILLHTASAAVYPRWRGEHVSA